MTLVDQTPAISDEPITDRQDSTQLFEHNLLLTVQAFWRLQQAIEDLNTSIGDLFT